MFSSRKAKNAVTQSKRLVVTGDSRSGKTCLLLRYHTKWYPEDYIPNVMEWVNTNISVFSRLVTLDLWDIQVYSCDFGDRLRPLSYVGASVVIICFGIDDPDSLINVEEVWNPEVRRYTKDTEPAILLVGCKMDIRTDSPVLRYMRERGIMVPVSVEQGRSMAKRIGAAIYLECSAKTGQGVDEVLFHAARLSLRARPA